jgi:hypothetical protein
MRVDLLDLLLFFLKGDSLPPLIASFLVNEIGIRLFYSVIQDNLAVKNAFLVPDELFCAPTDPRVYVGSGNVD